jgi:hypothetical protein
MLGGKRGIPMSVGSAIGAVEDVAGNVQFFHPLLYEAVDEV